MTILSVSLRIAKITSATLLVFGCSSSASTGGVQSSVRGDGPSACGSTWTVREPRLAAQDTVPLMAASAVLAGNELFIAGHATNPLKGYPGDGPAALRRWDGPALPLPVPESARPVFPTLGASGDTLYAAWGVRAIDSVHRVREVWYAWRTPATGWSTPALLAKTPGEIEWWWYSHSGFVRLPDGKLHLLFVLARTLDDADLVDVRFDGATTSTVRARLESGATYLSVATSGDRALASFISAAQDARDVNSVFVTSWDRATGAWSPQRMVSRSGVAAAVYPVLRTARDGRFHLIWGQSLDEGLTPEVARHVESTDGVQWSLPADLAMEGIHPTGGFAVGRSGVAATFVIHGARTQLHVACWENAWDVPRPVDTLPVLEARAVRGAAQPTFVILRRVSATRFENHLLLLP